jgi:predicted branched-subunit amino acid permease
MYKYISNFSYMDGDMYTVSLYWVVQTIATVGYGDVSLQNTNERGFALTIMIIGVLAFSYASGTLTSMIMDLDFKNMIFNKRIKTLENIRKIY